MTFIVTLVASDPLFPIEQSHFEHLRPKDDINWLCPDMACDMECDTCPELGDLYEQLEPSKIDVFITSPKNRRKKLLLSDMDSTIIAEESLDELAAHAGIKDRIAKITERSMRGELDFHQAMHERLKLLRGLPIENVHETMVNMTINPGAKTLIHTMKDYGATCVLVSGGFTHFTEIVAETLGFDHHHGNTLEIEKGKLTGRAVPPLQDKQAKRDYLQHYKDELGLKKSETLAIGDGSNDLLMLKESGLGFGYHAKPLVFREIDNQIIHGNLTAILYAQGFRKDEFVEDT